MTERPTESIRVNRMSRQAVSELREQQSERSAAADLVKQAKQEAAQIRANADQEWEAHLARLKDGSKEIIAETIDQEALIAGARTIAETMLTSHRIKQDFQALTPWLVELVCDATFQIIGYMDPMDRWVALLSQAMKNTQARWDVVLECHPDDRAALQSALTASETLAAAVHDIRSNEALSPGDCVFKTPKGAFDISLKTQMDRLRAALVEACETLSPTPSARPPAGNL